MGDEKERAKAIVAECERQGISPVRIVFRTAETTTVGMHKGQADQALVTTDNAVLVTGVVAGKLVSHGFASLEDQTPAEIAEALRAVDATGRPYKPEWFTKPGARLGKSDTYSSRLAELPLPFLKKAAAAVDQAASGYDRQVTLSAAASSHFSGKVLLLSSDGLDLGYRFDGFRLSSRVEVQGPDGKSHTASDTKEFHKNLDALDEKGFGEKVAAQALEKLGSRPVVSGTYAAVLAPAVAAALLVAATAHLSGTRIKKHLSVYEGKLGQDVFSPLLTVLNDPFIASGQATPFDSEGTPTEKFMAIDHGRLRCFFLDNEYGAELGQKSNGCYGGSECRAQYLVVTPSDTPASRLASDLGEGLIVTEIRGLETGLNRATLEFTLPFFGFMVADGHKTGPVAGTIAGKADELLLGITGVSREREDRSGCLCPWFAVQSLKASGD